MINRKLILDTETTGLDFDDDRIVEIGIIELIDDIRTNNNFHIYINPEKKISTKAQNVHGLTNEFLNKKKLFSDIADEFLKFISNDTLIIHNSNFDLSFLNKELTNCGRERIENVVIDTINLAKKEFPGQSVNLDSLCRKLNVVNTRKEYHGALLDADLLCKVYLRLTTGKQENLNFVNNNKSEMTKTNVKVEIKMPNREELKNISNEDYENHIKLIDSMKDPVWRKI